MIPTTSRDVAYWEMNGGFESAPADPSARDSVHLSNIVRCEAEGGPFEGLCIRYVARGEEDYRVDGRSYRLKPGQLFISTQTHGAQVQIAPKERKGTLGVCVFLGSVEPHWLPAPLIGTASCNPIGSILEKALRRLHTTNRGKRHLASSIVESLQAELPGFARQIISHASHNAALKPSTRGEMIRRAYLAQSYLHETLDRAIRLDELAAVVGVSPFLLLRNFQHCFGETPAAYHRKLRLNRAVAQAARAHVPISTLCDQFGFAGISSFSHAYRRAFGVNWRANDDA